MKQVRLLTFDSLPLPVFNAPDEAFVEAIWELTNQAAYFEAHYIQSPGLSLGSHSKADRVYAVGGGYENSIDGDTAIAIDSSAEINADCQSLPFVWVHRSNATDSPNTWPADFVECVNAVLTIGTSDDCLTIITALNGHPTALDGFDSIVPESQLRVPLWIQHTSIEGGTRYQQITGSFDIAATIDDFLTGPDQIQSTSGQTLLPAENRVADENRQLAIRLAGLRAIRSNEFLYVLMDDFRSALYEKPVDIWNVHDVKREFHEVVDRMDAALAALENEDTDSFEKGPQ